VGSVGVRFFWGWGAHPSVYGALRTPPPPGVAFRAEKPFGFQPTDQEISTLLFSLFLARATFFTLFANKISSRLENKAKGRVGAAKPAMV
jgi:hypothetical protein